MPSDHLSEAWITDLIERDIKKSWLMYLSPNFVAVKNYKFMIGELDEKYSIKPIQHHTYFSRRGIENISDMNIFEKTEMARLVNNLHDLGYYIYYNSPHDMTVNRFHFHAIYWEQHLGKSNVPNAKINRFYLWYMRIKRLISRLTKEAKKGKLKKVKFTKTQHGQYRGV